WNKIYLIGKSTLIISLLYGSLCAVGFALFRNELPQLFNKNASVLSLAGLLLLFAAVFQISDSTQAIGAGLLRGIKDVKTPTVLIGVAYWVIGLPVGLLLTFQFNMGPGGIWTGLIIGLTAASLLLIKRFLKMSRLNIGEKEVYTLHEQ
ncbi:MAG TPA: MATE family efflux transporter, partial [Chitinophagaceae bacterium]|nr:MATE family efflux transporter [Chitinophagaceae bacterium]